MNQFLCFTCLNKITIWIVVEKLLIIMFLLWTHVVLCGRTRYYEGAHFIHVIIVSGWVPSLDQTRFKVNLLRHNHVTNICIPWFSLTRIYPINPGKLSDKPTNAHRENKYTLENVLKPRASLYWFSLYHTTCCWVASSKTSSWLKSSHFKFRFYQS